MTMTELNPRSGRVAADEGETLLSCTLVLPADFRADDLLAFHARDALGVAERVEGRTLHKGIAWGGRPACLTLRFGVGRADAELAVVGRESPPPARFAMLVRHMLGLTQPVEEFERLYRDDAVLGPLIARRSGLRVPQAATPFEAVTWAVTGQQISMRAAITLRRRLIGVAGMSHPEGLACYPDAATLAAIEEPALRAAGFSRTKAQTLLALAAAVVAGELPLDDWVAAPPVDEIRRRLLAVRGVGPWTVDYTLLRGYAWLDGSLHGDLVVRRSLRDIFGREDSIGEHEAKRWLTAYSPWRALVAAHLWALHAVDP